MVYCVDVRHGKMGSKHNVENGKDGAIHWLRTNGMENIKTLNKVINETATPWFNKTKSKKVKMK